MFLNPVKSFIFGLTLPLSAAKLILKNKKLLVLSIFPIIVTSVLYFFLIRELQNDAQAWVESYLNNWGWSEWAVWLVKLFTQIVLLLVAALTFAFSSSLIASPFNDFLAEQTEKFGTPPLPAVPHQNFKKQLRLIGIDLLKTIAAAFAAFFAIILSWIPIINVGAFAFAFILVAFQYVSYPQTRREIGLKKSIFFLVKYPFACVGFGATVSFLFAIPFVSTLALPLAVVGGTLLFARSQPSLDLFSLR